MEEFVKEVFYAYPLLKTVDKDYQDHIQNRAVLSYRSAMTTEQLAQYLVEEIVQQRRFVWLRDRVEEVLSKLNEIEKTMVALRYFGRERQRDSQADAVLSAWGERKYFREQERLGDKLSGMLVGVGVNERVFEEWFLPTELFGAVRQRTQRRLQTVSEREKKWF